MPKVKVFIQQFKWKIILIRILVNAITLILTVLLIPDLYFATRTVGAVLIVAIALGVLNAIVKPVVLLLTGQFIFATYGLILVIVNALILYLLEWLFPTYLVVDNFVWALVGGAILSLVSNALENLLGLTMPIVPDEEVELRKRLEAGQPASLVDLVAKPGTVVHHDSETQSVSDLAGARAALEAIQGDSASAESSSNEPGSANPPAEIPPVEVLEEPPEPELDENAGETPQGGAQ